MNSFTQGDTSRQLCGAENKDLFHLLIASPEYNYLYPDELSDIYQQQHDTIIENLFFNASQEE